MATKPLYRLNPELIVTLKTPESEARSFSIRMKSLVKSLTFASITLFVLIVGTVLFLRELEHSRNLEDRLLQMEIRSLMAQKPAKIEVPLAVEKTRTPDTAKAAETKVTEPVHEATPAVATPPDTHSAPPTPSITARIQDFTTVCQDGICNVQVSLIPSQSGVAQGELLIVLEAEVPRIGSASSSSNIRKRFFIHPGNEARDELLDSQIPELGRKPFRFARALHTSAEFNVGEVLKPIAVNLYLFDANHSVVHHERETIEMGETHVE